MQTYKARELWNMDKEAVWGLPDGRIALIFDDDTRLEVDTKATIYSWYAGVFHRLYPRTPLLPRHHLGERQIGKGTEIDLLGEGLFDCRDVYGDEVDMEELSLIAYQNQNELYNDMTTRLKASVSTISILDFIEVMDHPEIKEANANVRPTQRSIDQTYDKIWTALCREGELKGNTVARMAKSGLVSEGQIKQCVGPRGFLTEIDSGIYRRPVLTGYVEGMRTLYDSMVESRSASKALMFAKDPVAESEYFNREMQLVASTLTRLHRGDCGSTEHLLFKVRSSSDLKLIAGKYYMLTDGSMQTVSSEDRNLIGQLIQMRSALKCQHPDPYGVCSTCMGGISDSIPNQTNLGHVSVTVMCEKISQNVLSTKHLDGSSKVDDFDIGNYDAQYIRSGVGVMVNQKSAGEEAESNTVIKLNDRLQGREIEMVLEATQASNISNIDYADIDKLAPSNVTSLTEVIFRVKGEDGIPEPPATVSVSMGARQSWLTAEALAYVKRKGFRLSDHGNYVIDLTEWDAELPLFQLPLKHTDMVQYMKTIKSFIMAAGDTGKKTKGVKTLGDFPTIDRGLVEFYNLINSKLNVNIAHLEVIILSAMIRSEAEHDHRLPRPIAKGELGSYRKNMEMRSVGISMAYERQAKRLTDVKSFIYPKRPDSPFDNILCPYPTVNPRE